MCPDSFCNANHKVTFQGFILQWTPVSADIHCAQCSAVLTHSRRRLSAKVWVCLLVLRSRWRTLWTGSRTGLHIGTARRRSTLRWRGHKHSSESSLNHFKYYKWSEKNFYHHSKYSDWAAARVLTFTVMETARRFLKWSLDCNYKYYFNYR